MAPTFSASRNADYEAISIARAQMPSVGDGKNRADRSTFGWGLSTFGRRGFTFLGWDRSTFGLDRATFWAGPFYLLFAGAVLLFAWAVLAFGWGRSTFGWGLSSSRASSSGPLGLFGALGEPVGGLWGSSGAEASVLFFRSCGGQPPHEPSCSKQAVKALMMPKLRGGEEARPGTSGQQREQQSPSQK